MAGPSGQPIWTLIVLPERLRFGKDYAPSGCLLPSLPSDATLDKFLGISFICDLNDNVPAQWPSRSLLTASSCNKTVRIPALPAATNAQNGLYTEYVAVYLLVASSTAITVLLQF
ncbi:hypothetical protein F3Y22_tig00112124pilonHSYRG00004 [Hibiscus syriacus]|uniref:Uncharacterized protein n=1 Tax=Hibiscus syriacus TaxID=106335 RepID=A0A6A2Y9B5_HIBSY|nr:hypothetical protein F3Y22_tig00112124pilonHSYRG00004 [Hibiscus syriacus]